ncbi:shikimate dehydrogenase (NADP(+)) [Polymorphobacter multimanifer]|nr:shikimate dehydrogenase (NADP(+)) [Polymorphobacter multimanifer]
MAGVIGWPVAHSRSPIIHRFWLARTGIDGEYSRFPVAPEALGAALGAMSALGIRGVNVTVPYKVAVMAHLATLDDSAKAVGAVNLVTALADGLAGSNTDIDGILAPLAGIALAGRRVVIAGAGGAARAAVVAMRRLQAGQIVLLARDPAKGAAMLESLGIPGDVLPMDARFKEAALLFNATTAGMMGQPPLAIDLGGMASDGIVFDAVYAPLETPLLAAARAHGLSVIDGLEMLIGQAARAFETIYGVAAPRMHDAELRALLTA